MTTARKQIASDWPTTQPLTSGAPGWHPQAPRFGRGMLGKTL